MTEWKERLAKSLGIDLPGLMELADELETDGVDGYYLVSRHYVCMTFAQRIRELCGEADA